jgi:hypothetical protein
MPPPHVARSQFRTLRRAGFSDAPEPAIGPRDSRGIGERPSLQDRHQKPSRLFLRALAGTVWPGWTLTRRSGPPLVPVLLALLGGALALNPDGLLPRIRAAARDGVPDFPRRHAGKSARSGRLSSRLEGTVERTRWILARSRWTAGSGIGPERALISRRHPRYIPCFLEAPSVHAATTCGEFL